MRWVGCWVLCKCEKRESRGGDGGEEKPLCRVESRESKTLMRVCAIFGT